MTKISKLIYKLWEDNKISQDEMVTTINILMEYNSKYQTQLLCGKDPDSVLDGLFKQ